MNKLKLFSKTYIFTMGIISLIILISNVLIYLALPKVYVNNKQKEADKIIEALIEQVSKSDNEESFKIAKNFAEKYNIPVIGHIPLVNLDAFYISGQKEVAHIEELTVKTIDDFGKSISKNPNSAYLKRIANSAFLILKLGIRRKFLAKPNFEHDQINHFVGSYCHHFTPLR